MKKKLFQVFFALSLILVSRFGYAEKAGGSFQISGKILLYPTGKIYLSYYYHNQTRIDSSLITDGQFSFRGELTGACEAHLRLISNKLVDQNAPYFFLSPGNIRLVLSAMPLKITMVSGSASQDELMVWKSADDLLKQQFERVLRGASDPATSNNTNYEDSLILYNKKKIEIEYNFAKSHPSSYITLYLLGYHYRNYLIKDLEDIYLGLGPDLRSTKEGRDLSDHIAQMKGVSINTASKNVIGLDYISQKGFELASLRGKYLLMDFWGSWCQPCIKLLPLQVKDHELYKGKNVEFISIASDDQGNQDRCRKIVKDLKMNWIHLWEDQQKKSKESISVQYDVRAFPTYIVIDPYGTIIARGEGEYGYLTCRKALDKLL